MISAIDLYDYIYAWKPYKKEAKELELILAQFGTKKGTILELACGTGKYISHLSDWKCTGVDLCERSIAIASLAVPEADFIVGNMKATGLETQFDVVICLFGGISYLQRSEVEDAIVHWRSLLKPEGYLVIEPWLEEKQIQFGKPFLHMYKSEKIYVSRTVVPKNEENACVLDFSFLLMRDREPIQRLFQRDILHLHKRESLMKSFRENDLTPMFEREGFLQESILWFFQKKG